MPLFRPGILRIFEQIVIKSLLAGRILIVKYAWCKPCDRIDHHQRRKFSSCQHIVADRNIICHDLFQRPFIDALIMSAKKYNIFLFCQLPGHFLMKGFSLGSKVYHPRFRSSFASAFFLYFFLYRPPAVIDGLRLHQHARASSIGIIIHFSMLILRIVPYINSFQRYDTVVDCPSENTVFGSLFDHFRK